MCITYLHVFDIIYTRFVKMPNGVVRQTDNREIHLSRHLHDISFLKNNEQGKEMTDLSETFSLRVLLEAKSWKVDTRAEHACFGQNTNTPDAIDFHLHIWVTVWVPKVGQVGPPCCIFSVSFNNHGVFVKCVRQC